MFIWTDFIENAGSVIVGGDRVQTLEGALVYSFVQFSEKCLKSITFRAVGVTPPRAANVKEVKHKRQIKFTSDLPC